MTNESAKQIKQPMFYSKPACIEVSRHGKAGLLPMKHCKFAAETNSIPLNVTEFTEAAKHYPIVFTSDETALPAVMVGLEISNYFVDAEGQWKTETYIPAYVRKYPFIFLDVPEQKQLVLCVDEASEQFCAEKTEDAVAFYDADKKPTELTKSALEFSKSYHNHHMLTREFSKAISEAGLLVPNTSTITLFNGRKVTLNGFQMIDEAKFTALPEKTILEFHKKGWLPFIHFALMSISNWERLGNMASIKEAKSKAA